jgi:hypothetical protein
LVSLGVTGIVHPLALWSIKTKKEDAPARAAGAVVSIIPEASPRLAPYQQAHEQPDVFFLHTTPDAIVITFIAETVREAVPDVADHVASVDLLHSDDENRTIAVRLREAAELLESKPDANPYRVRAYRQAADTIAALEQPVRDIFGDRGLDGLDALPGIGRGIAAVIAELLITGDWSQLRRLKGDFDPLGVLQSVPGIGPDLAREIHETLHVDTLEALEIACAAGGLSKVPGIGIRRGAAICASLTAMPDRRRIAMRARPSRRNARHPPAALLLEVDREYRNKAAERKLPTIAPKRYNPTGEAWLPILHTHRDGWQFTAVYSNTARAHELRTTHDWVVIYFHNDRHAEGQHTVVSETRGTLSGRRVVRGREPECRAHYARRPAFAA